MLALVIAALFLVGAAMVCVFLRNNPKPSEGGIAPLATIERQIARFELALAESETQEARDNAQGRLNYWMKEKRRA